VEVAMLVLARQAMLGAVVSLLAIGCSQQLKVEGKVTLDGAPLDEGSISFEPADGMGSEFGGTISAGNYVAEAPPTATPGPKIVRIRASRKTGKQVPAGPPFPPDKMVDEIVPLPSDYHDGGKLKTELKPGAGNHADFELVSKP
jgi:hypothetical protein